MFEITNLVHDNLLQFSCVAATITTTTNNILVAALYDLLVCVPVNIYYSNI